MRHILKNRKATFWIELAAAVVAFAGSIYYIIQSNIDECFNVLFFIAMMVGVVAVILNCFFRLNFLLVIAGCLWGASFGVSVYSMLPTLSDVWNGVNFIGGNLAAYCAYTIISALCAIGGIVVCFIGADKSVE